MRKKNHRSTSVPYFPCHLSPEAITNEWPIRIFSWLVGIQCLDFLIKFIQATKEQYPKKTKNSRTIQYYKYRNLQITWLHEINLAERKCIQYLVFMPFFTIFCTFLNIQQHCVQAGIQAYRAEKGSAFQMIFFSRKFVSRSNGKLLNYSRIAPIFFGLQQNHRGWCAYLSSQ